jgi:hypothetical protein
MAPVTGTAAGFLAAGAVGRLRRLAPGASWWTLLAHVLVSVIPGCSAALLVLAAAGALRGYCDPLQGLGFLAVGPLASTLTGAGLGLVLSLLLPGRLWPHLAWPVVVLAFLAWDVALVYLTPQVFVFDHLLGAFGGPLYDEAVGVEPRHLVFRLVTLLRLAPLLGLAAIVYDPARVRLARSRLARPAALSALGIALVTTLATFLAEPRLGLRSSEREVRRVLGATTTTEHLTIHHPAELSTRARELLASEAELRFEQLDTFFDHAPGERLTIYMFRTASEMRALTGTGPTNVAKPWLGATFVVYAPPPHPVLKHEMAHLFCASFGRGPLRTPGPLAGILADPLILEGVAVAADWNGDPLDPHTRSAAILEAGLIEDPSALVGLTGFYTHQGGLAYVMSGSFVRSLWSGHGPAAIRAWYAGASFEEAFGTTMDDALDTWEVGLRSTDVPDEWVDSLRRRYSRKSVFARPCPHQVALLLRHSAAARLEGDEEGSIRILDRICSIAPRDVGLRIVRLRALVATRRLERARQEIGEIQEQIPEPGGYHMTVLELAGDVAWLGGDRDAAGKRYALALDEAVQDEAVRMLTVKLWAVGPGPAQPELRDYLLGAPGSPAGDPGRGVVVLAGLVDDHPDSPLLSYLLGRALYNAGEWKRAARILARSSRLGLEEPVIAGEALRLEAMAHLWAGDHAAALSALDEVGDPPSASLGYHAAELRALVEADR